MFKFIFFFGLLGYSSAHCQLNFRTLRYEEDYSALRKDSANGWYQRAKFGPLSKNKKNYVSFGGDFRYQYFRIRNEKWGDEPRDGDGYLFSRLLLHSDVHLGNHFRTFFQLQSSMANGKVSTSPVDEDPLEVHQAFAEVDKHIGKAGKLFLRVGRQELAYGSQRLIAVRDGPNNRQSFDLVKIGWSSAHYQADAFLSTYVKAKKGLFNDKFGSGIKCWGGYITVNNFPVVRNLDIYYFGLWKKAAAFNDGAGSELRHSFGLRLFSNPGAFRYDIEMLWQSGKFATKQISAWTVSFNTGYQFKNARFKPELGIKTELISGDRHVGDHKLQTFNPLFPRGGYFGLASLIGPSNLFDIHPSLILFLPERLQLNLETDIFWRLSNEDGIYGPNVALIYSGNDNRYSKIGNQLSADLHYTPNPYLYFRLEFTWFEAGNYLKAAGSGKDIWFTGVTAQLKF